MIAHRKNILVKPFPASEYSEGGLLVPDSVKKPSNKVIVTSVGDRVTKVKEGQVGFRVKSWGEPVEIDGELHFIMDESAIIALQ